MKIILLKHGDKYNAEDVNRQAEKIREYCDHEILCLTEDPTGVITVSYTHLTLPTKA